MPVEPVLILLVAAVLANIALTVIVVATAITIRRRRSAIDEHWAVGPGRAPVEPGATVADEGEDVHDGGAPPAAYDRVVRIVAWIFILVTASLVAVTGLWPDTQPAIFALLLVTGAFVLVVHDLLPSGALGRAKFVIEGSLAFTFIALRVVLTGGAGSPLFYAYPLIVVGVALVVTPRVTFMLAMIASLGYVAAALVAPGGYPPTTGTIATIGINLTALILLAYVAMVVAREQRRSRDAAIRLSTIDSLTGLFNRAFLFAATEREIARSARSGRGFCLLMMDLDELKAVNDRWGHFVGDRVLRGVSEVIRGGVRRIDTPARYGGDEFVVLLPETDPTGAFVLAEKIRRGVADLAFNGSGRDIRTTVSIGVVVFPDDGRTADELMISADQAMYSSKRLGKNRVVDFASARAGSRTDRAM